MTDACQTFVAGIDAELGRLSCSAIVDASPPALAHLRADLVRLAGHVSAASWPGLPALAQTFEAAAPSITDAARAADLLTSIEAAWSQWKAAVAGTPEPTPVPVVRPGAGDDEVEVLRMDPEISGMFITEALDHLGTIEATVLELESNPRDQKLLNDVFRPFHTIKGNAGALGVTSVQEVAHEVERLLDLGRSGALDIGAAETEAILESVDLLTAMITDLPARIAGQPARDVRAARDALMATISALASGQAPPAAAHAATPAACVATAPHPAAPAAGHPDGADTVASSARQASAAPTGSEGATRLRRADDVAAQSVKVDTRKLDNLVDMVGELVIVQSIISADPTLAGLAGERLSRNLAQLRRITSDLQRNAMSMRMVPIRQTFQKMARLVRDLGRKSDKVVDLVLSGEDTELDRKVVEEINDPLMHMVRNSIDHGIEPAGVRARAGKPEAGRLSLSACHQGGSIVIAIADDGAGLNADRILAKAVSQGIVGAGEHLAPADIHQLIFRPGFSTAEQVTEISGRGVGMDVVRRNIDALRGRIEIATVPGRGTTFSIKLPLTLAIVEGLLLGAGGHRFVLPTFSVRESLRPTREQVHGVHGQPRMIQVRDALLPLVRLDDLFSIGRTRLAPWEATVVVIEDDGRRAAVVVDELLGKQEVVIKALGPVFARVRGVAGGAILGDGRIGLILDAGGLIALMGRSQTEAA
jgi:two-component system chemotaxis sensor kinase CheA